MITNRILTGLCLNTTIYVVLMLLLNQPITILGLVMTNLFYVCLSLILR
jgi:hypothetical protein